MNYRLIGLAGVLMIPKALFTPSGYYTRYGLRYSLEL